MNDEPFWQKERKNGMMAKAKEEVRRPKTIKLWLKNVRPFAESKLNFC